jgi:hypothetical protein
LLHQHWFRATLVVISSLTLILSSVYAVGLLVGNWGTNVRDPDLSFANHFAFHPATLLAATLVACLAAWVEHRAQNAAEFPVGLLIGELSVLLTLLFNALFLILGGQANWHSLVLLTFLIHLPLAVLEGIVLGFTVGFLARVKPEMLLGYRASPKLAAAPPALPSAAVALSAVKATTPVLVVLLLLATPSFAFAHKLYAAGRPLPDQRYQVESYFPAGYPPRDARAQVFRGDGTVLAEGDLNEKGVFVFHYDRPEDLKVVIRAAPGTIDEHTAVLLISAKDLAVTSSESSEPGRQSEAPIAVQDVRTFPMAEESLVAQMKDYLIGIGFLLALAAFLLSVRNYRQLKALSVKLARDSKPSPSQGPIGEPET